MASLKRFATLGGVTAVEADPNFNLTTLLLHGNGTNGAQNNTFLDSSTNNFTITRNGNTTQGTFTPFSQTGWSNYFNVTSSYLSAALGAEQAFGTGDFTVECFLNTTVSACNIMQPNASTNTWGFLTFSNNFYWQQGGANLFGTGTVPQNQWVHLAVSRSSGTLNAYVNGTRVYSAANTYNFIGTPTRFIGPGGGGSAPFYLSNVRIIKGTGLYSGTTITVPTLPLTAITNTALLTCQSNRFVDNSINNFALTITGAPSVQAFSPFAPTSAYNSSVVGGSGYFDGTGDYLNIADNAALRLGTSAFTIQAWIYRSVAGVAHSIIAKGTSTTGYVLQITSTNVLRFTHSSTNVDTTTTIPAGTWTHVAAVRTGTGTNEFQLYISGVSAVTATVATDFSQTDTLYIGADRLAATTMNGYISGVRYVVGTAETITIPTAPPSPTGAEICTTFTNAGIIDNTAKTNLETVGNAQISTSVKKYGTGSLAFDGTGDWLTFIDRPTTRLGSGNFTIEGWVYINAAGVAYGLISKGTATTGWSVNITSGDKLQFSYTSSNLTGATSLSANTWYYFAVVRSGTATGNLKLYLDGSVDATSGTAVTDNFNQTNIGYIGASRTATTPLNGYLDDVRITLAARTITTPTGPFPDQ